MMSRSAAPSSEVTIPIFLGSAGSGRFRSGLNSPFGLQSLLQLLERELQRPDALRLHVLADDLVLALGVVDAETTARYDVQTVLGLETQIVAGRTEHDGANLRRLVLEREVPLAGVPHAADREISPSTQMSPKCPSMTARSDAVSSETVTTFRREAGFGFSTLVSGGGSSSKG